VIVDAQVHLWRAKVQVRRWSAGVAARITHFTDELMFLSEEVRIASWDGNPRAAGFDRGFGLKDRARSESRPMPGKGVALPAARRCRRAVKIFATRAPD
jgi:hypothetical protein